MAVAMKAVVVAAVLSQALADSDEDFSAGNKKDKTGSCFVQTRKSSSLVQGTSAINFTEVTSLDGMLRGAAENAPISTTTKDLLRALRVCERCREYERYGDNNDGGYIMCSESELAAGLSAAYSYGISGYDGWGMSVAEKFRIPLYEYDCTNPTQPQLCKGCSRTFLSECLQGRDLPNKPSFGTLESQLRANGHANAPPSSILLKVDIEDSEWDVFANENAASLLPFRQIVVEFHNIGHYRHGPSTTDRHALYLRAVSSLLDAGFAVVHLHGNNWETLAQFGEYQIPNVLEVTFARKTRFDGNCPQNPQYHVPQDQVNNPTRQDLPDPKLPL